MHVGFVGLGWQGAPMARRIVDEGFELSLWARRASSLEPFRDTEAKPVSSLGELGARCDVVGICVVNDQDVEEVVVEGGLLAAMRPSSVIAIHSTVHPDTCRRLAVQAAERGVDIVDAPVSGSAEAAKTGALTVFVGGEEAAVARCRPIFETFGGLVVRVGPAGSGQLAKLVNNVLFIAGLGIAREALTFGDALGLDRGALGELLSVGTARSFAFERVRNPSDPETLMKGAVLLDKDLNLVGELARRIDFELDVLDPAARSAVNQMRAGL